MASIRAVFLLAFLAGAGCASAPPVSAQSRFQPAAEMVDTSTVPRLPDARLTSVRPARASTEYLSPRPVAETARDVIALLAAAGWQAFTDPFSVRQTGPNVSIHTLKRDRQLLDVTITAHAADGVRSRVFYQARALTNDLPFVPGAAEIRYDPLRPHLELVAPRSIAATLAFHRDELAARGWTQRTGPGSASNDGRAQQAFFVHASEQPLRLSLRALDAERTHVELRVVAADTLPGAPAARVPTGPGGVALLPPGAPGTGNTEFDARVRETLRQIAPAPGPAERGAPVATSPAAGTTPTGPLARQADSSAPMPVPEAARNLEVDEARGRVEFRSTAPIAALAEFYRRELVRAGFAERRAGIDRENLVVLNFERAGRDLTVTISRFGDGARVAGRGDALVSAAAARAAAIASDPVLEAEEIAGLVVPKPFGSRSQTSTRWRVEANATVAASVPGVLAFYRRELAARGWREAGEPEARDESAVARYASPRGPAILTLGRNGRETTVSLVVRLEAEARASGLLPPQGRARVVFGNTTDGDTTVTFEGRTLRVGPGVGAQAPDGPRLDLPPGSHRLSIRIGGGAARTETLRVGADEIWGVMLGPRGALPIQLY
jgi:hypothetical protein